MTRLRIVLGIPLLLAACASTQHSKKDVRDAFCAFVLAGETQDQDKLFDLLCRDNKRFYGAVIELARGKNLPEIKKEDAFTKAAIIAVLTEYDDERLAGLTVKEFFLTSGEGNLSLPRIPGQKLSQFDFVFEGDRAVVVPPESGIPGGLEKAISFVKDPGGWKFDAIRFARVYVKWMLMRQTGKEVPETVMSQAADIQIETLLAERMK
ncbi:MAG: hypothetical protein ACYS47_05885 [Planctomycetota bacterium]|jgi:hypothetical protein